MTRFARINRNKSSFVKIPDEGTSWTEFKEQMNQKYERQYDGDDPDTFQEVDHSNTAISKDIESTWCDFEESSTSKDDKTADKRTKLKKIAVDNVRHMNVKDDFEISDLGIKKKKKKSNQKNIDSLRQEYVNKNSTDSSLTKKKNMNVENIVDYDMVDNAEENRREKKGKHKKKAIDGSKQDYISDDAEGSVGDSKQDYINDEAEGSTFVKKKKKHARNINVDDSKQDYISDDIEGSTSLKRKKKYAENVGDSKQDYINDEAEGSTFVKKKKKHARNIHVDDNKQDYIGDDIEGCTFEKKKKKYVENVGDSKQDYINDEAEGSTFVKKKKKHISDEAEGSTFVRKKHIKDISVGDSAQEYDPEIYKGTSEKGYQRAKHNIQIKNKKDFKDKTFVVDGEKTVVTKFDGFYILKPDADQIEKLREKLLSEKRSTKEIEGIIRRHRRNAEKKFSRKKKRLCFNCREGIHNLSECPKLGNSKDAFTNVCYKCGSTEHSLHQCKVPGNQLKFAKCFICNENGHLSKQCPDNPRGLYPQGGSCRVCGDVTHLKRDCPKLMRGKRDNTITVGTIGDDVDCLEDDKKNETQSKTFISTKRVNKIIKF